MEKITIGLVGSEFTEATIFIGDFTQEGKIELNFEVDEEFRGIDNDFICAVDNQTLYNLNSQFYIEISKFISEQFKRVIFPKHIYGAYVLLNDEPDERDSAYFKMIDCEGGEIDVTDCQGRIYMRRIFEEDEEILDETCCIATRKSIVPSS